MPVVTAIKQQRRRQTRYSIYLDGAYSFALQDLELSTSGLRVGTELTEDQVASWQDEADTGKAYDLSLRYLSLRRRSQFEIRQYLRRKDYADGSINLVVERLTDAGLLDDAEFAAAWIRDRQLLRPRSSQMLSAELAKLGIARDVAKTALADSSIDEVDTITALIDRKQRQYPDPDKLMAYLAWQGFRYDQIKTALARRQELSEQ